MSQHIRSVKCHVQHKLTINMHSQYYIRLLSFPYSGNQSLLFVLAQFTLSLDSLLPIDSSTFLTTYVFGFSLTLSLQLVTHVRNNWQQWLTHFDNEASIPWKLIPMSVDNGRPFGHVLFSDAVFTFTVSSAVILP